MGSSNAGGGVAVVAVLSSSAPYPQLLSRRLEDNPNLYYYYDWESHRFPPWYNWQSHNNNKTKLVEATASTTDKTNNMPASGDYSKKENGTVTATATATTTATATPFAERTKEEQKLLLHQAAAMLQFLDTQGLAKSAKKVRLGLAKDLGQEGFAKLPLVPAGEWKFTPNQDYESSSSSEEESSSSSEEESSSSEEESSSSGSYETESESGSEYEEEMSDEEEGKGKKKSTAKKAAAAVGSSSTEPVRGVPRSHSFDSASRPSDDKKPVPPQRRGPPRRTVSFDDSHNKVHQLPKREGNKKDLYYDKYDIRRFKMEEQEEKLQESMALAASTFGLNFMTGKPA